RSDPFVYATGPPRMPRPAPTRPARLLPGVLERHRHDPHVLDVAALADDVHVPPLAVAPAVARRDHGGLFVEHRQLLRDVERVAPDRTVGLVAVAVVERHWRDHELQVA